MKILKNQPRTAKVGAISKAQNWKRGTLRALWNSSWLQKMKKTWRGDPLGTWKNFPKNFLKWDFWTVFTVWTGDPLRFFDIHCVAKYRNKRRGTLWCNPKSFKKSRIVPKKSGAMWGFLVCFRGSGRLFCFFFSFWTRFWGWSCWGLKLLRFDVVEQMNKKVDLSCLKKTTHCKSRAHFLLKCAD